ncbi:MAG: CpaF family protein [Pseudomonadota bacterium]
MFQRYKRHLSAGAAAGAAAAEETTTVPAPAAPYSSGSAGQSAPAPRPPAQVARRDPEQERMLALKVAMHQRLLDMLNLQAIEQASEESLRAEIAAIARELLDLDGVVVTPERFEVLVDDLYHEVVGLGPLEPLLQDETISDILVTTHRSVYVERFGMLEPCPVRFKDEPHLMRVIDKIVRSVGRRVDEAQPWVDARLPDGSRVNAMIPPCAVDGALLSIRKFSKQPYSVERLVEIETLSPEIAAYLRKVVGSRLNVLVSGGTGSGKTTTLNALSSFIGDRERIATIEDTAELQLQQPHVARMEARPPNVEGAGEITQRDLLKNALRMRPDRIIVGEVRGGEVLDMLQAMNTGHEGSMTTVHANSPRDALSRIENMVGMSGIDLPLRAVRTQMASAINVIIQVQRMSDGRRRCVSVQELIGSLEGDTVSMQEVFKFERSGVGADGGVRGALTDTGLRSIYSNRFREWGVEAEAV